uniref:NAD(P)/FAD-dependent oxidoreductase n=1 Tax=Acetatifactor sp. TaxID=1872090 RepID=UPI004056B166
MERLTIGIIGGGAAGMMAAITAAGQGAKVTILERGERVGKKILMTGNGKCNLGNLDLDIDKYYGSEKTWIAKAISCFGAEETVRFFQGCGLLLKNKNGYLYPASEQAAVVLDVLRNELNVLGVECITECKINKIQKEKVGKKILISDGKTEYLFDRVILACGSKAAPKTGSDGSGYKLAKQLGHSIIPTVPALVQLKCEETYLKAVAGVRAEGRIEVYRDGICVAAEKGEIQFTDYGISGIPVFQISRVVNYILREEKNVEVVLNLMPDYDKESFEQLIAGRKLLQTDRTVEAFFTGMLNKKLMTLFVKLSGLKANVPVEEASKEDVNRVYDYCRNWKLHVNGSNSYDNAQVCAGGVDVSEITEKMESRIVPGIYLAGELLDVDGKCGGYNLQWAWTSGYLAGMAASEK